jgi:hypothetical protein
MRTQLLTAISTLTSVTAYSGQFKVSTGLPWEQGGNPLYLKNLKTVYVSPERREETTLIPLIYGKEVWRDDIICDVYLACDAKTPPSQLDNFVNSVLATKTATTVSNFGVESDYTVETQEDVLIYTFEFRMNTITY